MDAQDEWDIHSPHTSPLPKGEGGFNGEGTLGWGDFDDYALIVGIEAFEFV